MAKIQFDSFDIDETAAIVDALAATGKIESVHYESGFAPDGLITVTVIGSYDTIVALCMTIDVDVEEIQN